MRNWRKKIILSSGVALILAGATSTHALTNEEILAQLQVLYQAVAAVQAQIQQLSPTPSESASAPAALASASCTRIATNLAFGMRDGASGGAVSLLQQFLKAAGDYAYPEITGYFGVATQSALQRYQARSGIVASGSPRTTGYGVAGPRTRERIQADSCGSASSPAPALPAPTLPVILPIVSSADACTVNGATVKNGASIQLYSTATAPLGLSCSAFVATRTCIDGTLSGTDVHRYASCASMSVKSCTAGSLTLAHNESRTLYDRASVSSGDTCSAHSQVRTCTDGTLSGISSFTIAACEGPRACVLDGATVADGQSKDFYFLQNIPSTELCSAYAASRSCTNGVLAGSSAYKYASCTPVSATSCSVDNIVLPTASSSVFYSAATAPAGKSCASISQTRSCTSGALSGSASYNRASCIDTLSCTLDGTTVAHASSSIFYSAPSVAYGSVCSSVSQTRTCTNSALSGSDTYAYARCSVAIPSSCVLDGTTIASGASATFYSARTVAAGSLCSSVAQVRACSDGALGGDAAYAYTSCSVNP